MRYVRMCEHFIICNFLISPYFVPLDLIGVSGKYCRYEDLEDLSMNDSTFVIL
nr:MAG TPA: hypothetical protein [Caudoviricetes sp.]